MEKKTMIVLDAYELECEIARRFGSTYLCDVGLRQALFYDNYQNDCCKYCSTEWIEENFYDDMNEKERRVLEEFLKILKEEGIEGNFLVDVTW